MTAISSSQMDMLSKATGLTEKQAALGQEQFLQLMMTQLQNQDPTAPMESADFLGQLAQFGTVSGIQGLQQQFVEVAETLSADRALRGASLLGKTALTPADRLSLGQDGDVRFSIDLPTPASEVQVQLEDGQGRLVRSIKLGAQNEGLLDIRWTGLDDDGRRLPPGDYRVRALASQGRGSEAVAVFQATTIKGVELASGSGDLRLELSDERTVELSQVRRIDE
jgi:flagellar basal-body rod modification protein FlgD